MLADVFENLKYVLSNIQLWSCEIYFSSWISMTSSFKTKVKLDLLTDIDMLLMEEKSIRGEICYSLYRYAKTNNNYVKDYDNNKESPYIRYWDVNNLCCCAISQKLPVNNFE